MSESGFELRLDHALIGLYSFGLLLLSIGVAVSSGIAGFMITMGIGILMLAFLLLMIYGM